MAEEIQTQQVHRGFSLTLNRDWRISAVEVADEENRLGWFESLEAAKAAIDKFYADKGRAEKEAKPVSIKALDTDGDPITVRGIHMGTGYVLTDRKGGYKERVIYPTASWISEAIKERKAIYARIHEIDKALGTVAVDARRNSYGRPDPSAFSRMIDRLLEHFTQAEEKAKANPLVG